MLIPASALSALLLVPAPAPSVPPSAPAAATLVVQEDERPTLGVTLDASATPLRILSVEPGSAAAVAGLRTGDRIVALGGEALPGGEAGFERLAAAIGEGGALTLTVEREGERLELRAVLGDVEGPEPAPEPEPAQDPETVPEPEPVPEPETSAPEAAAPEPAAAPEAPATPDDRAFLGVQIVDADGGAGFSGVVADSAAQRSGLLPGDVAVELDGEPLADGEALVAALRDRAPGDRVELVVLRDGDRLVFDVELGRRPQDLAAPSAPTRPALRIEAPEPPAAPGAAEAPEPPAELPVGLELELRFESLDGEGFDLERLQGDLDALMAEFDGDFDAERFEAEIEALLGGLGAEIEGAGLEFEWDVEVEREGRGARRGAGRREVRAVEARMERFEDDFERLFEGFEDRFTAAFERFEVDLDRSADRLSVELERVAAELATTLRTELEPLIEAAAATPPMRATPPTKVELPELIQLRAELDVVRAERDAANARVGQLENELGALRVEVRELIRAVEALQR